MTLFMVAIWRTYYKQGATGYIKPMPVLKGKGAQ